MVSELLKLCFLLIIVASIVNSNHDPTLAEITKALKLQTASSGFGFQARLQKSLRILIIGGSNSLGTCYSKYMAKVLENATAHPSYDVKVNVHAIGGCSPVTYIGRRYPFEDEQDPKTWPNVVMLDFAVNWFDLSSAAADMDAVLQTLKYKYSKAGVPPPDFVFLELFSVEHLLNQDMGASMEAKLLAIVGDAKTRMGGQSRGCPVCKEFREVASFYGYPTISWREMMFPAFVRYYLATNSSFHNHPWPYTHEGTHLSILGGQFLVDTLIVPFFTAAMAPRVAELSEEERSMYGVGVDVRMFPPAKRTFQILTLSTLNHNSINTSSTLFDAIRKPMDYQHIERQRNAQGWFNGNECYGSKNKNSIVHIDFAVPLECNVLESCKVTMEWIHSWNTSRYGPTICDLMTLKKQKWTILETRLINVTTFDGEIAMKHTGPVTTKFSAAVKEGNYTMTCKKLDDVMSCVSGLAVVGTVLL